MSERYWVNGAQLGLLAGIPDEAKRKEIIDEIAENQFITNCWTEEDKAVFITLMKKIKVTE